MEDAMIINKASYERGFAHGSVYKSEFIELKSVSVLVTECQIQKFVFNHIQKKKLFNKFKKFKRLK
jgi:DNA-directed RNA polymerase beta subunit